MTAWVNRKGLEGAFTVGRAVNETGGRMKFNDTLGQVVSRAPVNYSNNHAGSYIPAEKMKKALAELTGKPVYQYINIALLNC